MRFCCVRIPGVYLFTALSSVAATTVAPLIIALYPMKTQALAKFEPLVEEIIKKQMFELLSHWHARNPGAAARPSLPPSRIMGLLTRYERAFDRISTKASQIHPESKVQGGKLKDYSLYLIHKSGIMKQ
jgi:hypothetical protein